MIYQVNFSSMSEVNATAVFAGDNPKEMTTALANEATWFSVRDFRKMLSENCGFVVWDIDFDDYNPRFIKRFDSNLRGWSVYNSGNIHDKYNIILATCVTDLLLSTKISDEDIVLRGIRPPYCHIVTWMKWQKPIAEIALRAFGGNAERVIDTSLIKGQGVLFKVISSWMD